MPEEKAEKPGVKFPIVSIEYARFLRDLLPGFLLILIFIDLLMLVYSMLYLNVAQSVTSIIVINEEKNISPDWYIILLFLLFSPIIGLVSNLASYAIFESMTFYWCKRRSFLFFITNLLYKFFMWFGSIKTPFLDKLYRSSINNYKVSRMFKIKDCEEQRKPCRERREFSFSIGIGYQNVLNNHNLQNIPDDFKREFQNNGLELSRHTAFEVKKAGRQWMVKNKDSGQAYMIRKKNDILNIYVRKKEGYKIFISQLGSIFDLNAGIKGNIPDIGEHVSSIAVFLRSMALVCLLFLPDAALRAFFPFKEGKPLFWFVALCVSSFAIFVCLALARVARVFRDETRARYFHLMEEV